MRFFLTLAALLVAVPAHAIPTVKRAAKSVEPPPIVVPQKAKKAKPAAAQLQGGVVTFALTDLGSPKNVSLAGPNTVVIEVTRSAATTKSTRVRVSVDGKVNKIVALRETSTLHLVTLSPGTHVLTFAAALGKTAAGQVVVRYKDAAGEATVSEAPVEADAASLAIPKGSYLSAIAFETYGSEDLWPAIYEVNKARVGTDPNRVEAGTELYVPDAREAQAWMAWIRSERKGPAPQTGHGRLLVVGAPKAVAVEKREAISFLPLIGGEAWTPLISELLYERGKVPGVSARVISGTAKHAGTSHTVMLSLNTNGREVSRVERSWNRGSLDSELGAALDALLSSPKIDTAQTAPATTRTETRTQVTEYRYRTAAWILTVAGAAGLASGLALLIANRLMLSSVTGLVEAYNARSIRTEAEFAPISAQRDTLIGLGVGAYVALGVGAAALAAGIVLFVIDRGDTRVTLVPTGSGAAFAGTF